jgi:hypothetical protein
LSENLLAALVLEFGPQPQQLLSMCYLGHEEYAGQRTHIYDLNGSQCGEEIYSSKMDEKREEISVKWFGCLYRLLKSLDFCQKIAFGNLEVVKYKIIGLKHSR